MRVVVSVWEEVPFGHAHMSKRYLCTKPLRGSLPVVPRTRVAHAGRTAAPDIESSYVASSTMKGAAMQHPILAKVRSDIELRNYSDGTAAVYLRACTRYLEHIGGRPLEETSESDLRAFCEHLAGDCGLAPKTVNTYLGAVLFMYEVGLDRTVLESGVFSHR